MEAYLKHVKEAEADRAGREEPDTSGLMQHSSAIHDVPASPASPTLTQGLEDLLEEAGWLEFVEEEHTTDWEGLTDLFGGLFEEHTTDWDGLSALFSKLFDEPMPGPQAAAAAPSVINLTSVSEDEEFVNLTASPADEEPAMQRPLLPVAAVRRCGGFDDDEMDPWIEGEQDDDEEI